MCMSPTSEVLPTNRLRDQGFIASPAIADTMLYLRGQNTVRHPVADEGGDANPPTGLRVHRYLRPHRH